jgi:hypothetical protein
MRLLARSASVVVLYATLTALAQGSLDGTWKGKTSQGRDITINVKNGAISSLNFGLRLKLTSPCAKPGSPVATDYRGGEATSSYAKPVPVINGTFTLMSGVSDVDAKISGKFAGSTLTGNIEMKASPGSGCSGKDVATWSATQAASRK